MKPIPDNAAMANNAASQLLEYAGMQDERPSDSRVIQKDLLSRLYLGIMSLIQYVEAAPPGNTLRWFGDNRTPVKTLPDFGYARDAAAELKEGINRDCSNERI